MSIKQHKCWEPIINRTVFEAATKKNAELIIKLETKTECEFDPISRIQIQLMPYDELKAVAIEMAEKKPKLKKPPGSLMLRVAEIMVSKETYERDCEEAINDWRIEYYEALDQNRGKAKMAFIRIRHTWAFFKTTGWLVGLDMVTKLLVKLIKKISGA